MTTTQCIGTENFKLQTMTAGISEKSKKPGVIKIASILMYIMAFLIVLTVLSGRPVAAIFIPLVVYLAYGLSILKASARKGTIGYACFGLIVNLGAFIASEFTMTAVLVDLVFYVTILTLLFWPSARNAAWNR